MAVLEYQSQLTVTTATNSSQQMGQYMQTLAHQQDLLHQNQHQMMEQMVALFFNQSNAGRGIGRQGHDPPPPPAPVAPNRFGCTNYGGRGGQGRGCGRNRGRGPPTFNAGCASPITLFTAEREPGYMGIPPATVRGYYAPPPQAQQVQPPPYLNVMKRFANWNA